MRLRRHAWRSRRASLAAAALAGALCSPAAAQTTLTADDVARRAVATSPALAARRADVEAAAAAVTEARVALLPRIAGTARYTRLSPITAPTLGNLVVTPQPGAITADNFPTSVAARFPVLLDHYVLQAGASVPLSDYLLRFPHTTTAATEAAAAARAQQRAEETRLAGDARVLYYEWARARLQHDVATSAREQTRAHLDFAKARRDAGGSTIADVLRVESQLAAADLLALRTQNLAELLEDQLRTVLHDPGTTPYVVGDDLDPPAPPAPAPSTAPPAPSPAASPTTAPASEAAYRDALERRAELAALGHASAGEQAMGRATRALVLPRLELYGGVMSGNPNPRFFPHQDRFDTTWEAGVTLTFSPNDLAAGLAIARRHQARSAATQAEAQRLAEVIRVEVSAAARAQQEAASATATTARGLAAAEESYRVRRALFTEGRATSVELTDAETDVVRARLAAIDARIDAGLARVRWQKATGESP